MSQAGKLGSVKGLWHAAGILDDHLMADLEREHLWLGSFFGSWLRPGWNHVDEVTLRQ
jgi:hypothetical protein